jgi:hypothetical protein
LKERELDTTLTLNIPQNVVDNAEIYAKYAQKSVSQLVEEYLLLISSENVSGNNKPLGPITKQLAGIIKLEKNINHKELLADTLTEKYL